MYRKKYKIRLEFNTKLLNSRRIMQQNFPHPAAPQPQAVCRQYLRPAALAPADCRPYIAMIAVKSHLYRVSAIGLLAVCRVSQIDICIFENIDK